MTSYRSFQLSITKALGDQLAEALSELTPTPLTTENIAQMERRAGVYLLFRDSVLVYVGKADGSIPTRLTNHRKKISGRVGISLTEMSFVALYVNEDFRAVAPETLLIQGYRDQGLAAWNNNGFGNKDPGRERDTSTVSADHFDRLFPVDLNWECDLELEGESAIAGAILAKLKANLPYLLRYPEHADLQSATVSLPVGPTTADALFGSIIEELPGWQLTALPGYTILYKEHREYSSAQKVYRQGA